MTPTFRRSEISRTFRSAGLTVDPHSGEFERPVADRAWLVPSKVWVEGDLLRSETLPEDLSSEVTSNPQRRISEPMLRHFLELADAEGDDIAAYAGNNGLLNVCPHGIPGFHSPEAPGSSFIGRFFVVHARRTESVDRRCSSLTWREAAAEPLSTWREFSRSCRALLQAAAAIHDRRLPDPNSFARLTGINLSENDDRDPDLVRTLPIATATVIDNLLSAYGPHLSFTWASGPPELAFSTRTLTSALVLTLASACAQSGGIAICSGCTRVYAPSRKPASGRRRYCQSCHKDKVPIRDAQRDLRARRAHGRSPRNRMPGP